VDRKLTPKQQRFVDFYDGNATGAARKAGYKNPERSGKQNVRLRTIAEAIKSRETERSAPLIADREERQEFWTECLRLDVKDLVDEKGALLEAHKLNKAGRIIQSIKTTSNGGKTTVEYKVLDRLKASELLGRSEADFIDRHRIGGDEEGVPIKVTDFPPEPKTLNEWIKQLSIIDAAYAKQKAGTA